MRAHEQPAMDALEVNAISAFCSSLLSVSEQPGAYLNVLAARCGVHSARSVWDGSTRVALKEGRYDAATPINNKIPVTAASVNGS